MNCPLCIDQALEVHRRGGIEIDVCPNCHGVWLDRDELDRLMDADVSASRSSVAQAPADTSVGSKPAKAKSDKKKGEKKRKKSLGERLGDVLEDVLDI